MLNSPMVNIENISDSSIKKACEILLSGGLVAIPTETVYGLGGDGTNPIAVQAIFTAKGRPSFNPLISHVCDINMLEQIAIVHDTARKIIDAFCPGGITLILQRTQDCPVAKTACADLNTIAVRIPAHTQTLALIKSFGRPIVAPSANKSGHISPTTAEHVKSSLGEKVDLILDGGQCTAGLESTIIDMSMNAPCLLRAGAIRKEAIEAILGAPLAEKTFAKGNNPIAPGQLKSHYAPDMPLYMNIDTPNPKHAYLGFGDCAQCDLNLSPNADLKEAGKNLFDYLHKLNNNGVLAIDIAPIPNVGIGVAINDKLVRASAKKE